MLFELPGLDLCHACQWRHLQCFQSVLVRLHGLFPDILISPLCFSDRSDALKGNSMWENTIGVAFDTGSNAAVEATIYAPTRGGRGGGIAGRRERAQQLLDATGMEQQVTNYQDLVALAQAQSVIGGATRGACKICGGLGHLTKQCRNHLSSNAAAGGAAAGAAGGAIAGSDPAAIAAARGLLEDSDELSLSSSGSDFSDSDSGSSSDGGAKKRKREKKDRKEKKHKKEKKSKKHKKEKKHHKSKDHRSDGHRDRKRRRRSDEDRF